MRTTLIENIKLFLLEKYKTGPLLVFSLGRIKIIGKQPSYNDGFVFTAAINKGIITAIQKSTADLCTVVSADFNETYEFSFAGL